MPTSPEPLAADDATIKAAIADAHLPSLIAAVVHLTGDTSLVTGDIKPLYDFFGDGQGGLTDAQKTRVQAAAFDAIKAHFAKGKPKTAPLSMDVIRG